MGRNMKKDNVFSRKVALLGQEIRIHIFDTGDGMNVLIEGGDRGHIGAVAAAGPDLAVNVVTFPGHREDVICKRWAEVLAGAFQSPVVVSAGVHYDGIGHREIQTIIDALEQVLKEIVEVKRERESFNYE